MKELRKFYANWLIAVALTVAIGTHILSTTVFPALEQAFPQHPWVHSLAAAIVSRPALVVIIGAAEWFIRKKLWRWRHPELDFSGTWEGVSTYTRRHVGKGPLPQPAVHQARIEQDCLNFRLIPSGGDRFVTFESTSANLIDAHRLVYSYRVIYKGEGNALFETYGYEEMNMTQEPDSKGRPQELHGWFAHCVRPQQTAAYSGTVVFKRKSP